MRTPSPYEILVTHSKGWADYCMRDKGWCQPAFFVRNDEDNNTHSFFYTGGEFFEVEREKYAVACRLFAMAHNANACAFVSEVWTVPPGKYNSKILPSEHEERIEGIAINTETKTHLIPVFLPILRDRNGKYSDLGEPEIFHFERSNKKVGRRGRFADLLPPFDVPADLRKKTLALLNLKQV